MKLQHDIKKLWGFNFQKISQKIAKEVNYLMIERTQIECKIHIYKCP